MRHLKQFIVLAIFICGFVSSQADIWDYAVEDDYEFKMYYYYKGYESTLYKAFHGKLITFDLTYKGVDRDGKEFTGQSPIRILRETDPETHLYTNNVILSHGHYSVFRKRDLQSRYSHQVQGYC